MSGGQQQRVQLVRALALDRDNVLLDEPVAARLRGDMCLQIKHLREKVGITFVHVIRNQEEAMTVADRIALIDGIEKVARTVLRRDNPPEPGAPVNLTWPETAAWLHLD